jgi:hypothetical protein
MKNFAYSPLAFPYEFSRIVAEATMYLPPMTRPQDTVFLERSLADVIDIFWSNYISHLSNEAQNAYSIAEDEETGQAMLEWHQVYANFSKEPEAVRLASEVLQEIADKLPSALKSEYDSFTEADAFAE